MDDRVGGELDAGQEAVKWLTRHAIKCKPGSRDVKDREDIKQASTEDGV